MANGTDDKAVNNEEALGVSARKHYLLMCMMVVMDAHVQRHVTRKSAKQRPQILCCFLTVKKRGPEVWISG